jgi:fumarate hydratase subunit alpha
VLEASQIADAVRNAIPRAATELRPDVLEALRRAVATERSQRGRAILEQLIENCRIAADQRAPLCQDTGTVWVRVEVGTEECLTGDLQSAVDEAVRDAFRSARLRMSVVRDALLDRSNTADNTPAFLEIAQRPGVGATVHVMLKGGGSDNASRVAMLDPAEGWDGVRAFALATVTSTATGACPPLIVGVGVGTTFDKVAALAKRALLVPLGTPAANSRLTAFEAELLAEINAAGIGPAGLGGDTTALGVRVLSAPCHIAALPVAVNVGCNSMRVVTTEVSPA